MVTPKIWVGIGDGQYAEEIGCLGFTEFPKSILIFLGRVRFGALAHNVVIERYARILNRCEEALLWWLIRSLEEWIEELACSMMRWDELGKRRRVPVTCIGTTGVYRLYLSQPKVVQKVHGYHKQV